MIGDVSSARQTLEQMSHEQQDRLPGLLQAMGENNWNRALELAERLAENTKTLADVNNAAVLHLIQGELDEVGRMFVLVLQAHGAL